MIFPHAIWPTLRSVTEAILRSGGKIIVDISKHMGGRSRRNQATMLDGLGGPAHSDTNPHFAQICS